MILANKFREIAFYCMCRVRVPCTVSVAAEHWATKTQNRTNDTGSRQMPECQQRHEEKKQPSLYHNAP